MKNGTRIKKMRAAYIKMDKIFKSHPLNLKIKIKFLEFYVFLVLLYRIEVWTIIATSCKRLEAFKMWLYRRMLKISQIDHII